MCAEMSRAMVELDFFEMEKHKRFCKEPTHNQRSTVKDIQKAMSRIDPQLLKTMFGNGGLDGKLPETNLTQMKQISHDGRDVSSILNQTTRPSGFPIRNFAYRHGYAKSAGSVLPLQKIQTSVTRSLLERTKEAPSESSSETRMSVGEGAKGSAPLTIFYNGTVSVFDISRDKAEMIIKLSEEFNNERTESADTSVSVCSNSQGEASEDATFDMPIARTNSLMRFLEKRRERLTSSSPYTVRPKDRGMINPLADLMHAYGVLN